MFYYMLKFGGHILLSNTCLVPVRHLAMRAVLHLVLLAQCIAVKDEKDKEQRTWEKMLDQARSFLIVGFCMILF